MQRPIFVILVAVTISAHGIMGAMERRKKLKILHYEDGASRCKRYGGQFSALEFPVLFGDV